MRIFETKKGCKIAAASGDDRRCLMLNFAARYSYIWLRFVQTSNCIWKYKSKFTRMVKRHL